jgi:hypothetical protein
MPESRTIGDITVGPPDLGWTVTTLKMHFDAVLADRQRQHEQLRAHYDSLLAAAKSERETIRSHYDVLIRESDRRYEARFTKIEESVVTAFAAQEKATSSALQAQKDANAIALAGQKEAINKAEAADDSKFRAVNEFRELVNDLMNRLVPRAEHAAIANALQEKIDSLQTRIDRGEGRGSGLQAGWGYLIGGVGLFLTVLTIGGIIFAIAR